MAKSYSLAPSVSMSGKPDKTLPTVSLTAPSNGSTVSGIVTLTATAADNVGVIRVEFYVNAVFLGTDTSVPYQISWNSTTVVNGTTTLRARAVDAAGNKRDSANVVVTVVNNVTDITSPTVTMTAPIDGSTVSGTVLIAATAADNVAVARVDFYAGGLVVGTATSAPYQMSWDSLTHVDGSVVLTAKAYDVAGNSALSSQTVNVLNALIDSTPPTSAITAPSDGSTVSGFVTFTATATDNVGVARVDFYVNTTQVGTSSVAPYQVSWDSRTVANGSVALAVKAYDAAGNYRSSPNVFVTINNSAVVTGDYYVSPSGSDLNSGTSTGAPFKTLQKAANVATAGKVVIVMDGVYTVTGDRVMELNTSGTIGNPITFKAQNKWGAIIDGQNYVTTFGIVFLSGASYINIDGFQLRYIGTGAFWIFGTNAAPVHDVKITNCWTHDISRVQIADCADGGGRVGAYCDGYVHHVIWDRNLWHDIGRVPNLACDANLGTTPNYRHDHALYLQGKYHTVTNNIFYNMYAGWAIKCDGFYGTLTNSTDPSHTIRNNTFAFPSVPREISGHIRFFSNTPPETDSGNTMNKAINVLIENNISYQPPYYSGTGAASPGPTFIAALYDGVMSYTGTVVRNNITTVASVIDEVSGGSEITGKVTLANNLVNTDPLLLNTGTNDFHLTGSSPAVGTGRAPMPTVDFAGTTRTTNDIGAYKY